MRPNASQAQTIRARHTASRPRIRIRSTQSFSPSLKDKPESRVTRAPGAERSGGDHQIGGTTVCIHTRRPDMIRNLLCAAALAVVSATAASSQDAPDNRAKVTLVYDQVLPN